MTKQTLIRAVGAARTTIERHETGARPRRIHDPAWLPVVSGRPHLPALTLTAAEHLLWMCETVLELAELDRFDKAMRWLGFIQGSLWALGWRTIEDVRRDNRKQQAGT